MRKTKLVLGAGLVMTAATLVTTMYLAFDQAQHPITREIGLNITDLERTFTPTSSSTPTATPFQRSTSSPSLHHSLTPTALQLQRPTISPSFQPPHYPSESPSQSQSPQSLFPSNAPSLTPTSTPTHQPVLPTKMPTVEPYSPCSPFLSATVPNWKEGICDGDRDVIFLMDESRSVNPEEFAALQTFVNQIVRRLESVNGTLRFALSLFATDVRTEVLLGDGFNSTNANRFQEVVAGLRKDNGFTCLSGGMDAAFYSNFGQLDDDGGVDRHKTRLRADVPVVFFILADGVPNFKPQYDSSCKTVSGNCECDVFDESTSSSQSVYAQIKAAASEKYRNRVIAMKVGIDVDDSFLADISDARLSSNGVDDLCGFVERAAHLLTCDDATLAPVKPPTSTPTLLQSATVPPTLPAPPMATTNNIPVKS